MIAPPSRIRIGVILGVSPDILHRILYLKSYLKSCLKVVEIMGLSHQKCIFDVDNLLFITKLYIH